MLSKYFWFYLFATLFAIILCEKHYILKWTRLNCQSLDENFIRIQKCELKIVERNVTEISGHFQLLKGPINDLVFTLRITRRNFERTALLELKVDVCAFFRNKRQQPMVDFLYRFLQIAKYTNGNHTCPYDHDLILDKFHVAPYGAIPFPVGSFKAKVVTYVEKIPRMDSAVDFEFMEV